jgi:hypothetical protein
MGQSHVTVWVDRDALGLRTRVGRETELRAQPEAGAAIRHLIDADCRVVLWGAPSGGEEAALPAEIESTATLPDDASGWLVTADEGRCGQARNHRGLRTILVGPTVPGRGLAHRASDLEARDLLDAVLAILTADAMPEVQQPVGT